MDNSSKKKLPSNLISIVSVPSSPSPPPSYSRPSSNTENSYPQISSRRSSDLSSSTNNMSNSSKSEQSHSFANSDSKPSTSSNSTTRRTLNLTPTNATHKRVKSMNDTNTVLAYSNGQVRRMRSILDMRLGCLVAAGMPLEEDGGHMSPLSSPSPYSSITNSTQLFAEQEQNQQPVDIGCYSPPEPPAPPPACIDFDGISDECDAFNLNSPHSILSPNPNPNITNNAVNTSTIGFNTCNITTTEKRSCFNTQIKLLTISNNEDTTKTISTTNSNPFSNMNSTSSLQKERNLENNKVDVFGITIPTPSSHISTSMNGNGNGNGFTPACSSTCTLLSTSTSSDEDDSLESARKGNERIPFTETTTSTATITADQAENENDLEVDDALLTSASAMSACSVLLAESSSRLDLSALLC